MRDKLERLDESKLLSELAESGGVYFENFFTAETISQVLDELSQAKGSDLNGNNSDLVYYNTQKFVSQSLVHSKSIYDFLISRKIFGIAQALLGKPVVKATRYYMTGGGGVSMWHHDEKNEGYHSRGFIMIIYLSDVLDKNDGPFEFIKGTHLTSLDMDDSDFFAEKIKRRYKDRITTVFGKAGTLIFADSRVIHRAMPHNNKEYRESLFFQISRYEKEMYKERILVNPAFFSKKDMKDLNILEYLGFGVRTVPHIFPPSSLHTVPINYEILSKIFNWVWSRSKSRAFEVLPVGLKKKIRAKLGRNLDYEAIRK